MDPDFWLKRWQDNEIGFHAAEVQPALIKYWPALQLHRSARVLVPLCGKSLDMIWLAGQGHFVFGVELAEIAVREFVHNHLSNATEIENERFKIFASHPFELWCGDFFKLNRLDCGATAAYDRAALVAMPPEMQGKYAEQLAELLPKGGKVLLIGLDYDRNEIQGPPFNISQARVRELFEKNFDISLLEARDGLAKSEHLKKRGVTRLEEASYLMVRA